MKLSLLIGSIGTTVVVAGGVVGIQYGITKYRIATPEPAAIEQPAPAESVETTPELPSVSKPTPSPAPRATLSGTYRCWSFNVGGRGQKCTSPPIVFNADGSYSMSSEHGTYTVNGDTVVLSQSKIRGPGTLLEDKLQLRFEYSYNGLAQTVTYLKQETKITKPSTASAGPVYLDLTIKYSAPYSAIDSITTIELKPQGGGITYEALAYATDDQTLKAYYKPARGGVPGGEIYDVFAGGVNVGIVDLRQASGEVARTLQAVAP
jgi:hypothetical protein